MKSSEYEGKKREGKGKTTEKKVGNHSQGQNKQQRLRTAGGISKAQIDKKGEMGKHKRKLKKGAKGPPKGRVGKWKNWNGWGKK